MLNNNNKGKGASEDKDMMKDQSVDGKKSIMGDDHVVDEKNDNDNNTMHLDVTEENEESTHTTTTAAAVAAAGDAPNLITTTAVAANPTQVNDMAGTQTLPSQGLFTGLAVQAASAPAAAGIQPAPAVTTVAANGLVYPSHVASVSSSSKTKSGDEGGEDKIRWQRGRDWTKVVNKTASCWAGTRIDYLWVSPNFPFPILQCHRIDTDCSDHFPVRLVFGAGNKEVHDDDDVHQEIHHDGKDEHTKEKEGTM